MLVTHWSTSAIVPASTEVVDGPSEGPVNWSATTGFGNDSWNGYVVIQAKQRQHPEDPNSNAVWLRQQIDAEFDE